MENLINTHTQTEKKQTNKRRKVYLNNDKKKHKLNYSL